MLSRGKIPITITFLMLLIGLYHWFFTTIPTFSRPMVSSEDGYSRLASGVAWSSPNTRYPINYVWPPLTPIFYSYAHLINPVQPYLSIRWTAWALILFSTIIVGLIGYRLSKNVPVAVLCTTIALTNPLFINLSTQTLSENIWLPLVGLAILFLISTDQKQWKWGYIFWSLSQMVRYESWYLSPLLILVFWLLHRHLKNTLILFLTSLVFPLYWYLQTSLDTGNFHFYLDEKLLQAKHGSPYIYHHLIPSIGVWVKQLLSSVTPPQIMTFLVGAYYLSRRNNYFYLIPIFIFFSLIAQVYFATMEIFPGRYLCLLPLFIIPISLSFLYHDSHLSKTTFFIGAISLILLDLITTSVRLNSLSDKVLSDQIAVGSFISTTNSPCVVYLKSSASPRFDHSAFWYFSRLPMTKVIFQRVDDPYTNYKLPTTCYLVVVEKTPEHPGNKESIPRFFGQPIFENFYFQVFEPPVIKNRVLNGQK